MCTTPTKVLPTNTSVQLSEMVKIRCGGGHILILDKNNRLHACGWNNKGQLGLDSIADSYLITALSEFNAQIIDMACGWDSTAAIDENGQLYVWGSNTFEQLGFSAKKTASLFKVPVSLNLPSNEKVQTVSFGLRFMCILCDCGTIYVIGRWKYTDKFDTVCHNDTNFYRLLPSNHSAVTHISTGSNHIVCIDDSQSVIGFGDNKFYQRENRPIEKERVKSLRSGWTHNGILTENGSVYLWGRNSYGQLGRSSKIEASSGFSKLEPIEGKITNLNLGSEHGMIVTEHGTVFTWGWNEHGNCGNGDETNVYVIFCHVIFHTSFEYYLHIDNNFVSFTGMCRIGFVYLENVY